MQANNTKGKINKILIVEDDFSTATLIKNNLEEQQYQVDIITSGKEALKHIEEKNDALILLDYTLLDMKANEFLYKLIEKDIHPQFIIMTGYDDIIKAVEMMKLGARDYLFKDSKFFEVIPTVVSHVIEEINNEKEKEIQAIESKIALEKSEERYRTITETITDYIYSVAVKNSTVIQTIHGPACISVTGYTPEEFNKNQYLWIEMVHDDDKKIVTEQSKLALAGIQTKPIEHRLIKKDGSMCWVKSTIVLHFNTDAILVSYDGLIQDITERKQAEEKLFKLNEELEDRVKKRTQELEDAYKNLESFSYSVSHDLRTPLRHIQGYSELIEIEAKTSLNEAAKEYLIKVKNSVDKMNKLINDLLFFSKTKQTELNYIEININDIIDETILISKNETEGRKIKWKIQKIPKINGDYSMVRQVVFNLISNALKYTKNCKESIIEIGISEIKHDYVTIFIKDNGVGFDMKYSNKLFGVFQRLHREEDFEGTGIGLAIVKSIINKHGGDIKCYAEVDNGASFYFSLPVKINKST